MYHAHDFISTNHGYLIYKIMHTASFALAKYVNDKQSDWNEKINSMLFANRKSIHLSTKVAPFYLVYGRQARLPVDLALPSGIEENLSEEEP